jgi:hypothetical protein
MAWLYCDQPSNFMPYARGHAGQIVDTPPNKVAFSFDHDTDTIRIDEPALLEPNQA